MEKQLTVIVPAYNTERYLNECIDSMLRVDDSNQLEIIIVDDGSKDRTGEIADIYALKWPNTVKVIHKQNGGHGSAINTGISLASGRYSKIVDSDDWVDTNAFKLFLEALSGAHCDIVATPFCINYRGKVRRQKIEGAKNRPKGVMLQFENVAESCHIRMHEMTIRTELLKHHGILLTENSFYVDMQFITFPIPWVKTISFFEYYVYQYRLGCESQSVSVRSMQKNRKQHLDVMESLMNLYKCRKNVGDGAYILKYIAKSISKMENNQVQICLSMPISRSAKEELIRSENAVKANCVEAYTSVEGNFIKRACILLLRISRYRLYPMAAIIWRLLK